jgi:Pyruvate/2-oxoacid:ferredoxin oxidoreductase delta subunit
VEIPASSRPARRSRIAQEPTYCPFFLWSSCSAGKSRHSRVPHTPYNYWPDQELLFFLEPSTLTVAVLTSLLLLSALIRNPWCRFLCPYGALLGVLGALSPLRIHRRRDRCTGCGRCSRGCPSEILVHSAREVRSPECTGCLTCVARCPVPGTLTVRASERRALSPYLVPLLAVGSMTLLWAGARLSGRWETRVPIDVLAPLYQRASNLHHP